MKSAVGAAVFVAGVSGQSVFPGCMEPNAILRGKGGSDHEYALFTDVSMYGLSGCFLDNCQNSDKWISVSYASCADACAKTPECKHWTYGLEDGSQKCWLRTGDGGKENLQGYLQAPINCHPADYPGCIQADVLYGPGQDNSEAIFSDLTRLGRTEGCAGDDCKNSDKYWSPSPVDCATTCANVEGCKFWSFGVESDHSTCFLRSGDASPIPLGGFSSGRGDCAPLSAWESQSNKLTSPQIGKAVEPGNLECWGGGFDFSVCCHPTHGPLGNGHCWDGDQFTFKRCCIPPSHQEL